jgi:DNA-binding MarR family transcriptional regulator
MLLSRATTLVLQEEVLRGIRDAEMGPTKMNLMRLLRRQKKQSVNDLARFLGQTKAAASQNVDSLVRANIVKRESDKVDRRCVWVSLTPRGTRVLQKAETRQRKALRKALGAVPKAVVDKASATMRVLANAILESSESHSSNCLQCCAYNSSGCVYDHGKWRCNYLLKGEVKSSGCGGR